MSKHTPGPWEINGRTIETVASPAYVIGQAYCGLGAAPKRATADANARLMAAAPELLAALTEVMKIMRYYHTDGRPEHASHEDVCTIPDNCGHCIAAKAARMAIAKATGAA